MTTIDEALDRAAKRLGDATDVAIACHMNPDPDALGSALGLSNYLQANGVNTVVSFGNDPFAKPRWVLELPGHEALVPPAEFPKAPELLVTCDAASLDRLGSLVGRVDKAGEVIWIDHHRSNDGLGTIPVIDPTGSSTCELVWRLVTRMGGEIPDATAACCYAGLVTDTGRFQYEAVKPQTLEVAAHIRSYDFDHTRLVQALYDDNSVPYLRLLGAALQRVAYDEEADLVWTYLTRADLAGADLHPSETDDLIDVVRTAREADVAAVFKQQAGGKYKASLRSRGSSDVSAVAQAFGGGGHRLAAGYTATGGLQEAVDALTSALREQHAAKSAATA